VPELLADEKILISDYTFEKDALFARINLKGDELEMYYRVHEALGEKITPPDLMIYLRAETDTLMNRIALRDRAYERNMEINYIDDLKRAYDDFFIYLPNQQSAVLVIDSDQIDFVHNPDDLREIENRIRRSLQLPPFQPELPIS
jgi:deoxyguanosine kinase